MKSRNGLFLAFFLLLAMFLIWNVNRVERPQRTDEEIRILVDYYDYRFPGGDLSVYQDILTMTNCGELQDNYERMKEESQIPYSKHWKGYRSAFKEQISFMVCDG